MGGHQPSRPVLTDSAVFKKFEKENLFQILCAGELQAMVRG